jgi:hypothetical protein
MFKFCSINFLSLIFMKYLNKFLMFTIALGLVFLSSCTNEEKLSSYVAEEGPGTLSFVLPLGKGGPITYGTIAATAPEDSIAVFKIYWFKPDGKLFRVFSTDATGVELPIANYIKSATQITGTIPTGTETGVSHFYCVANVNKDGGTGIRSTALSHVTLGGTTETEFQVMMLDELDEKPDGNLTEIECPLPMSLSKVGNGGLPYLAIDPGSQFVATGKLNRRVARFDILNNAGFTGFHITNVVISNAKTAGYAQDTTGGTFNTGRMVIDVESTANGTPFPQTSDATEDDGNRPAAKDTAIPDNRIPDIFDTGELDSLELNKSQFYLYPTKLSAFGGSGTVIALEGIYQGETRVYSLDVESAGIDIVANKAYKIRIKRYLENSINFTFTIEPWDWDEDSIKTHRVDSMVKFAHIIPSPTDTSVVDTTNLIAPDEALNGASTAANMVDTIRYTVPPGQTYTTVLLINTGYTLGDSINKGGVTSISLQPNYPGYLQEDSLAILNANHACSINTIRTYATAGGLSYETTHTIALPHTRAPIAFDLIVTSATNTDRKKKYYFESWDYDKLGYPPVKVGSVLWAPLNLGATVVPAVRKTITTVDRTNYTYTGNYFQWGRNIPFSLMAADNKTTNTQFTDIDLANTDSSMVNNDHWFKNGEDADFWGKVSGDSAKAKGPCPVGWHVPSVQDAVDFLSTSNTTITYSNNWFTIVSKAPDIRFQKTLYIPTSGILDHNNQISSYTGGQNYWMWLNEYSSNVNPHRMFLSISGSQYHNAIPSNGDYPGRGFIVRCVRDASLAP